MLFSARPLHKLHCLFYKSHNIYTVSPLLYLMVFNVISMLMLIILLNHNKSSDNCLGADVEDAPVYSDTTAVSCSVVGCQVNCCCLGLSFCPPVDGAV